MNKLHLLILALPLAAACDAGSLPAADEHADEHAAEDERGPNGGRLLADGDFTLELAIFEAGVPPEFHAWATADGRPLAPADVALTVELARLGGRVDRIEFAPQNDFLRGTEVVEEPHSFDVTIVARHAGRDHRFEYASYEGRTAIAADVARAAGIGTATAGPGTISDELVLYGAIAPDATRVRAVHARFPGVIRSRQPQRRRRRALRRRARDDRIEREPADLCGHGTDQRHRHRAPRRRRRADRHRCAVRDRGFLVGVGRARRVLARPRTARAPGSPSPSPATTAPPPRGPSTTLRRSATARRRASRRASSSTTPTAQWTPGQFVEGRVTIGDDARRARRPALGAAALPRVRRRVRPGRRDVRGPHAHARPPRRALRRGARGLAPGTTYVTDNSYLIKADIEKSGASHDH